MFRVDGTLGPLKTLSPDHTRSAVEHHRLEGAQPPV